MLNHWADSIIIFSSCIAAGALLEFILIDRFKKVAARTRWEGDEVILKAMGGITLIWFILIGAYIAAIYSPLDARNIIHTKKIILVAGILITTLFVSRLISGFIRAYTQRVSEKFPVSSIFTTVTRIFVYSIGLLLVFQSLGISITPILTALGVGGLALALALQDTLSNLFAGFHILASKSIRPGDYVKLQSGEEGYIHDINWRVTSIKAPDHLIVIPNSKVATAIVLNYYLPEQKTILRVPVSVSYSSDLAKVEDVSLKLAKEFILKTDGCTPEDEPAVRFQKFEEHGIQLAVMIRVQEYDLQFKVRHEFIKVLHAKFKEEGIEFAAPTRHVKNIA